MANPELIRVLDYILNRSDESSIDVLAAAIIRRRRDIAMFGSTPNMPDPQRLAKEISSQVNSGVNSGVDGLRKSIREMAMRIIAQQAPELSDEQIEELSRAMLPDTGVEESSPIHGDLLASMIDQFVSFSRGAMPRAEDKELRDEMGPWPERYWKAFPPVIRSIISDFLKDRISEKEFKSKIDIALAI